MNVRKIAIAATLTIAVCSVLGYLLIRYEKYVWSLPLCQRELCAVAKFHGVLLKIPRSYTFGPIEYAGDEFWAGKLTQPNSSDKAFKSFAIALARGTTSPIVDDAGNKKSPKDNYKSWISILFDSAVTLESVQPFRTRLSQLCGDTDQKSEIRADSLSLVNCRGRYTKSTQTEFWDDMNIYFNESRNLIILESWKYASGPTERTVSSCEMYLPVHRLDTLVQINFSCSDVNKWPEIIVHTNQVIDFFRTIKGI